MSLISHILFTVGVCLNILMLLSAHLSDGKRSKDRSPISCSQRDRLIGIKDRDRVVTVERLPGARLTLTCHYCGERDSGDSKRWYYSPSLWNVTEAGSEVDTMAGARSLTDSKPRYSLSGHHSLTINSLDVNDTGLYYCYNTGHSINSKKFIYAVDMLFPQAVDPVEGNSDADLNGYMRNVINRTISQGLKTRPRFERVQLYLQWEPWSRCHACRDEPGQMWRQGVLRMRHADLLQNETRNARGQVSMAYKTGLAARSTHVFLREKQLSLLLRQLPDYVQKINCSSPRACRRIKSFRNRRAETSFLARLGPEPKKRFSHTVYEHDAAILECPWPPLRTIRERLRDLAAKTTVGRWLGFKTAKRPEKRDVDWYFHAHKLNKSSIFESSLHRIRISRNGRLMIGAVQKIDQGRYSCSEEGITIAIINLKIKPTFNMAQSRTSLRFLAVGCLFNFMVFSVVMVVICKQRRVQRLLAGARWRHELRRQRREEHDRKMRLVLQARRGLLSDKVTAEKAEELTELLEDSMFSPNESIDDFLEDTSISNKQYSDVKKNEGTNREDLINQQPVQEPPVEANITQTSMKEPKLLGGEQTFNGVHMPNVT